MTVNSKCKICDSTIESFMTFRDISIANGFINNNDFL